MPLHVSSTMCSSSGGQNCIQFLFYNKLIIFLYMFRALCAHHQAVKIVLYSIWYRHTCRWPYRAQVERGRDGHLQSAMIPDAVQYNFNLLMIST